MANRLPNTIDGQQGIPDASAKLNRELVAEVLRLPEPET